MDEVPTLPLTPPKGGSKSGFVFLNNIQVQSHKVSLYENFSGKVTKAHQRANAILRSFVSRDVALLAVSYTHLTLPTNREV